MLDITNAKSMARSLRTSLSERSIDLPHSTCLELVAQQFGYANWNILAARFDKPAKPAKPLAVPKDWTAFGAVDPSMHRLGVDPAQPGVMVIECLVERGRPADFRSNAYLMQSIAAQAFLGRRIRLTAELSTVDADLGTLWMRVDGFARRSLAFDNMMARKEDGPIGGTTDWTRRSVVLDVPMEAASLHYGFFLKGYGCLRLRRCRLDIVGDEIPVTTFRECGETSDVSRLPKQPLNLDFCAH